MPAKTRVYKVQPQTIVNGERAAALLIEATTPSQAIRHAARNAFTATVATPREMYELGQAGVKIETAVEEESLQVSIDIPLNLTPPEVTILREPDAPTAEPDPPANPKHPEISEGAAANRTRKRNA